MFQKIFKNSKRINDLVAWNSRRTELEGEKDRLSSARSDGEEYLTRCRLRLDQAQAQVDWYDGPLGEHERRRERPQNWREDYEQCRDELGAAQADFQKAEEAVQASSKDHDRAQAVLAAHLDRRPQVTESDLKNSAKQIADLRSELERTRARLEELEAAPPGEHDKAASALQEAQEQYEAMAAAASLGDATPTELKAAHDSLNKAEEKAQRAAESSRGHDASVTGLRRRIEQLESSLNEAEEIRQEGIAEFCTALHKDAVGRLNDHLVNPTLSNAVKDIGVASALLRKTRSGSVLTNGELAVSVDLPQHAYISGFEGVRIRADMKDVDKAVSQLATNFGLVQPEAVEEVEDIEDAA